MNSKPSKPEPSPQTTDLLGDAPHALDLTNERVDTVRKQWPKPKGQTQKSSYPFLILTTKENLKNTRSPRSSSRFEKVLSTLRPQFKKVLPYANQVTVFEADSGRQILSGGHIANAALNLNGYCIAHILTAAEAKIMKTEELQLLHTSFSTKHKKIDRINLVRKWKECHSKVFNNNDIKQNLRYLFDVTERTIFNDLKEISNND